MKSQRAGQGLVEYIIIVVIVALAAIAILGIFGDTIRQKLSGAVTELGGDADAAQQAAQGSSEQYLKDLK